MNRRYKDTFVGKGSDLAAALEKSEHAAKIVYEVTTANFFKLYGKDAGWFINKHKEGTNNGS
jgi:hypothetical protein